MNILPKTLLEENYLGLSLNQSSIRAVEIDKTKKILAQAQVPLDPGVFAQGSMDQQTLVQALKTLFASAHFTSRYAAISIPEYYSFTRTYSIPIIPLSDVSEALNWQIEKIFPLPKNEIYFDWKLLSQSETMLNLLIVAMPRQTLDGLIAVFEFEDIKAIRFEPLASALTQVIDTKEDQTTILVEINPYGSSATLIVNNISVLTITNQFRPNQESQVSLQQTSGSIQSLMTYHSNKYAQNQNPINFLLTGDSANQELANWLGTVLGQQIAILNIPGVAAEYQQAYAVASSCMKTHDVGSSLNLLPTQIQAMYDAAKHKQKVLSQAKIIATISVLSLLTTLGINGITYMQTKSLQTQLRQIEAANAQYSYNANIVSTLNKNSVQIATLFNRKNTPVNAFSELFETLPEGIEITNIVYESDSKIFTLTGSAAERAQLLAFKELLDSSDRFSSVALPLESLEKPRDINFQLTTKLLAPVPAAAATP